VIVFSTPGDPNDDPDPIPPLNVDVMRPTLNDVFLAAPRFSLAGTTLHFALDDSSVVGAEVWHVSHGHRAAYAGWEQWRGHIGFNEVRFGSRRRRFEPRPGRYVAFLMPTDFFNNVGHTKSLRFTISPPHRRDHRSAS
jgi:hypothetical protein